jgi:Kef-type K+ transport system membrane component KefB
MSRRRLVLSYLLLVGSPFALLLLVLRVGSSLRAPAAAAAVSHGSGAGAPAATMNLPLLIFQIAVILLASRLVGMLFRKLKQPQVIGEIIAGILLGPSLLGWAAPSVAAAIFPAASLGYLNALSQIGLILFMFTVGVSLNPDELRGHGQAAMLISHASMVTPFCLGSALALLMYPHLSTANTSFMNFALFIGAAMSITAFPVLARMLTERNLLRSRMGGLAISCAAVDDISGWCILAYVAVVIRAETSATPLPVVIAGIGVYALVMLLAVRPLLTHFESYFTRRGRLTEDAIACMIALSLLSALTTEWLRIHSLFGAFFMGAIMPKREDFVRAVVAKLESVSVVVLLPLFFALSGLRSNIGMVSYATWGYAALIILTAIAGKFGGSMVASRMAGLPWRESSAIGILMNTRGLMELIALNIGLDLGVISPTVFTMMVLMALVTTFMTSPLLALVMSETEEAYESVPASQPRYHERSLESVTIS